jgi:hypothetical protein
MTSHFAVALGVLRVGRRNATIGRAKLTVVPRTAAQLHRHHLTVALKNSVSHVHAPIAVFAPHHMFAAVGPTGDTASNMRQVPQALSLPTPSLERLVRRVEQRTIRVERSEMTVVRESAHQSRPDWPVDRGMRPGERAPEMVVARPVAAAPPSHSMLIPPARIEATNQWKPPNATALAQDVLRELDRRVVAERERLGRLS